MIPCLGGMTVRSTRQACTMSCGSLASLALNYLAVVECTYPTYLQR